MNTYPTIEGAFYVVTATTETQVTDEHGLALTVAAGKQESFLATGDSVNYDGQCHFQQVRGNFKLPSTGDGGGGQPVAPTPEPLGTTTTLKHGHVYTLAVAGNTDLSALTVELYGTAELWIDYTAGSVDVSGWDWQEDAPDNWEAGKRYCVVLRNDGDTIATVNYIKDTPAQS